MKSLNNINTRVMLYEYSEIPEGQLAKRLEFLADILGPNNIGFIGREMERISGKLAPDYQRRIEGNEMYQSENMLFQELCTETGEDMNEVIADIFSALSENAANMRNEMMSIMEKYSKEQISAYGNRLMMLADLMKGARQICLSRGELILFVRFSSAEMKRLARKIGNDY